MAEGLFQTPDEPLITGLVEAAAPPPITLTHVELARLAREIAMDIKERRDTLEVFKLTEAQYEQIEKHPLYERMLTAAVIEWNSAKSTPDRLKIEAAAILEEALPHIGARMTKPAESLAMQVQAGTLLAKIAGVGEGGAAPAAQGEKFVISINLGADKEHYERNRATTITVAAGNGEISTDVQGARDERALPALGKAD